MAYECTKMRKDERRHLKKPLAFFAAITTPRADLFAEVVNRTLHEFPDHVVMRLLEFFFRDVLLIQRYIQMTLSAVRVRHGQSRRIVAFLQMRIVHELLALLN